MTTSSDGERRGEPGVLGALFLKFVSFAGVGAIGTTGHYLLLVSLVSGLGVDPVLGSCAGFVLGALINYWLNYRYTFRSDRRHSVTLPRFLTVALMGFLINSAIMFVLTGPAALHYIFAQVVATGVVLIFGFAMNLLWTFGRQS